MPLIKQKAEGVTQSNIRGGEGRATLFHADAPLEDGPVTMAARIELEPGASIGFHLHDCNEEVYAVMSGEGTYEFDGGSCPAAAGDIFTTRKGMSHGLRNTGSSKLVIFAVVAK